MFHMLGVFIVCLLGQEFIVLIVDLCSKCAVPAKIVNSALRLLWPQ